MDTIDGAWWLPSQPQTRVFGTLQMSSEGDITLQMTDRLVRLNPTPEGSSEAPSDLFAEEIPVILGTTHTGVHITVYRCRRRRIMVSMATLQAGGPELYSATAVFVGGHFASVDAIRFHRVQVESSYLPEWAGMSGFRSAWIEGPPMAFSDEAKKYEVVYGPPDPVTAPITDGTVTIMATMRASQIPMREVTLLQRVWFDCAIANELTIEDWFAHYITPFQHLLGLATSRPNKVVRLQMFSRLVVMPMNAHQLVRLLNRGRPVAPEDEPISAYFASTLEAENEKRSRLDRDQMLFRLSDVSQTLGDILNRWFIAAKELDSVYGLYFDVLSSTDMGMERRFLNMVQAAESYHRRRFPNAVLDEKDHDARVTAVLATASPEYRQWLDGQLQFSNEPRLKKRLKDLFDMAAPALAPIVGDTNSKRSKFIQWVVDTRNDLTHYDTSLVARSAHGKDLEKLTTIITLLVQVCFLRELGLAPEKWKELLEGYRAYRNTVAGREATSPL